MTDPRAAITFEAVAALMLAAPDLTGDLLLLAIALAHHVVVVRRGRRRDLKPWAVKVGEACGRDRQWVWYVIRRDVPRYDTPPPGSWTCTAPMMRRDGPCGQSGSHRLIDHDPHTGERTQLPRCARHAKTARPGIEARRRQWIANGSPEPPPNTGGVLPRYFGGDWDAIYTWADPYTHNRGQAQRPTARPPRPPRPKLTLIHGDKQEERNP